METTDKLIDGDFSTEHDSNKGLSAEPFGKRETITVQVPTAAGAKYVPIEIDIPYKSIEAFIERYGDFDRLVGVLLEGLRIKVRSYGKGRFLKHYRDQHNHLDAIEMMQADIDEWQPPVWTAKGTAKAPTSDSMAKSFDRMSGDGQIAFLVGTGITTNMLRSMDLSSFKFTVADVERYRIKNKEIA